MICFHGTRDPESVLKGIDLDAPRARDPGDFGWGFYCTLNLARACNHGHVLRVDVDLSEFAHINYPYFLNKGEPVEPITPEEKLLHGILFTNGEGLMRTVRGSSSSREEVAKEVRREFLRHGWKGIVSESLEELVVFDASVVRSVHRVAAVKECVGCAELFDEEDFDDEGVCYLCREHFENKEALRDEELRQSLEYISDHAEEGL